MVTIRPITFTPASRPAQTRYLPTGATQRPITYTPPERHTIEATTRPAGLTQPTGTATLTPDTIQARSQHVVNTRSAPYSHYVVQGGSWYGVRTVDGMEVRERLNPATADTYPNPDYRYKYQNTAPTFTEGSAGNVQIAASARPEAPGPGSSKAAITAYSEAAASWEREQMWRSIDPSMSYQDITTAWDKIRFDVPTQERREYEIAGALLPTGPTAKQLTIEQQYAAQRGTIVSSSGTLTPTAAGYKYASGEVFKPTAAAEPAPAVATLGAMPKVEMPGAGVGLISAIAREKLGVDYITGGTMLTSAMQTKNVPAVAGPLVPVETMLAVRSAALALPGISTMWSAGEYMGLDYLLGVKIAEYEKEYKGLESQGLIVGDEFRGSEEQYTALNAKYNQIGAIQKLQDTALNRTLGGNVAEARAGTAATGFIHGGGAAITKTAADPWKSVFTEGIAGIEKIAGPGSLLGAVGLTYTPFTPLVLTQFVKGVGQGVAAVPEFIGMGIVGAEGLIKHPEAFPGAVMLGGYIQAKGIYEGVTTRPAEFAGEMYGTALALHAVGRVSYAASPIKYTSAIFEAEGRPTATYRGLYAESPIMGLRKLVGTRIEFVGTRNVAGTTSYKGIPWYRPQVSRGTPSHLIDYIGTGFPDFPGLVVKVPLVKEKLIRSGDITGARHFESDIKLLDELTGIRPSKIKNPFVEITKIEGISKESGADLLNFLEKNVPEYRITGSFPQQVQSVKSRPAADIDLYVNKSNISLVKQFARDWNQKYKTNIKIDIHDYQEPGSYIGRYGVRVEPDIKIEGIRMISLREQALRKLTTSMMLRETGGRWYLGPEGKRGKDIADITGVVESEIIRLQQSPLSFLHRRRITTLESRVASLKELMEPGALPIERVGGSTFDPARAAARRYGEYTVDFTESPYMKIPGTRTYVDPAPFLNLFDVSETYRRFGVPEGTPAGIIFETGGRIRLHPEEMKMWEQMVVDESRGVIPREDIRLFTKKGELLRDFKKKREFGSVDIRLSNKAQRALDASTHTHPLSETIEPAYYLKSEIWFDRFLDRFRKQPKWEPADFTGKSEIFYQHEYSIPAIDAPLHTGDMFSGLEHGERVHAALTKNAVYVGRLPKDFFIRRRGSVVNDPYTGKLYEQILTRRLRESGGRLSDIERSKLGWEVYREVALRSAGRAYSRMGGVYTRYPIEEITNFAEFSSQALKALESTRKTPIEFERFTLGRGTGRWIQGLSKTHKSIPEGTPTTKISIEAYKTYEYPDAFTPARAPGVTPIITYPAATSFQTLFPQFKGLYPSNLFQHPEGKFTGYPQLFKKPHRAKQLITPYPGITKMPFNYPGIVPPEIPALYPPITPPVRTKYPPTIPPTKTPPTTPTIYPPVFSPPPTQKVPPAYPPAIPPPEIIPPVVVPPFQPPTKTPPQRPPTSPPIIPPETPPWRPPITPPTPLTIPRHFLTLTEETPKKKPKIKLGPDVLASAWNIESPIPRIRQAFGHGWGLPLAKQQRRNELAISNLQKSRIPTVYVWKLPFEQTRKINVPKVI